MCNRQPPARPVLYSQQWEYMVAFLQAGAEMAKTMNDAGRLGWECFAATESKFGIKLYLKRRKAAP